MKFIAYYDQFDSGDNEHFLLSMKHVLNGDSLLSVAKDRGDVTIQRWLSMCSKSSSNTLNRIFSQYSDYVNRTFNAIRNEISDVCFLMFYTVLLVSLL